MHLTKENLEELSITAKEAAIAAGAIIANAQGSSIKVNQKDGGENIASQVVTEIDLKAQEVIIKILSPTIKKFDLGLLAEESNDDNSRLHKDFFWCIDPLDGTLSFSRNEDGYSTSIALVSKSGDPIIGVVLNPRTNDLYHAIKDEGAFKNNTPFRIGTPLGHLTLLYDQSFIKLPNFKEELNNLEARAKELKLTKVVLHHLGGAVMNGLSTIELAPAIYYKHPKKAIGGGSLWDFAASSVIQSEAGGFNSDYYGNPLDLNREDSTFMNHKGVIYCSAINLSSINNKTC
jgi:fructose-1,6-bisphosphatase/inositol monophosphatase family enzyme